MTDILLVNDCSIPVGVVRVVAVDIVFVDVVDIVDTVVVVVADSLQEVAVATTVVVVAVYPQLAAPPVG